MLLVAIILFIIFQPGVVFTLVPSKFIINIFVHGILYGFLIFLLTRDDKKTRDRKKLLEKLKKEIEENKKKEGFQNMPRLLLPINQYNTGPSTGTPVLDTTDKVVDDDEAFRAVDVIFSKKVADQEFRKSLKKDDPIFKKAFTKAYNVINPRMTTTQAFTDYKTDEPPTRFPPLQGQKEGFQAEITPADLTVTSPNAKPIGPFRVETDGSQTFIYDDGTYKNISQTDKGVKSEVIGKIDSGGIKTPIVLTTKLPTGIFSVVQNDYVDNSSDPPRRYTKGDTIKNDKNGNTIHRDSTGTLKSSSSSSYGNKATSGAVFAAMALSMCFGNQMGCVIGNVMNHGGRDCSQGLNDTPNPPSASPVANMVMKLNHKGSATIHEVITGNVGNRPLTNRTFTNPLDGFRIQNIL